MSDLTPPSARGGPPPKHKPDPGPRRLWLTGQAGADTTVPDSEQFDALTELFLGEVSRPRRHSEEPQPEPRKRPEPGESPRLRLTRVDEPEAAPPQPEPAPAPVAMAAPPAADSARPAFVECLIVGNLPVLASAWASQYIREIAEISGRPIATVRVQAGYATVELVGGGPVIDPATAPAPLNLESALRLAASRTDRWVLRVDAAEELAAAGRPLIRLITLLTGADESARVATYGSLKSLAEKLPPADAQSVSPLVRVAIMSAPKDDAGAAAASIVATARHKLGRDIQHAICSSRIKAVTSPTILFNGKTEATPTLLIDMLEKVVGFVPEQATPAASVAADEFTIARPSDQPQSPPPDPTLIAQDLETAPIEVEPPTTVAEISAKPESPASPAPIIAPPVVPPPAAAPVAPPQPLPVDDLRLWGASGAQAEPKAARTGGDDATLCIHVAGVRSLQLTCPYAKDVQFGIDDTGCMHLLARGQNGDDESTLGRLMAASAWLDAHRPLVTAALGLPQATASPQQLHLFTSQARRSRPLLDTDVRVHLLAPVVVNGSSGWFCTELN